MSNKMEAKKIAERILFLNLILLILAFAATIPTANWMISNLGTLCVTDGPCLIPVGFGLMAPSGVLLIGLSLVLRDAIQEVGGTKAALISIGIGGLLSWFVAQPALVIASVTAFICAELSDLVVYTPLRHRNLGLAVLASGAVGSFIDSALFLWLAFGSLDYIAGQVLGKLWISIAATLVLIAIKKKQSQN